VCRAGATHLGRGAAIVLGDEVGLVTELLEPAKLVVPGDPAWPPQPAAHRPATTVMDVTTAFTFAIPEKALCRLRAPIYSRR
jgi:hypothetical protein